MCGLRADSGQISYAETMRIVAGTARGRTLLAPKDAKTIRPTSDKVRQSLFNVLGQWCEGWRVLDLYTGTGALALEALSRGAARAVLVDSGREAQKLSEQNAAALGFTAQTEVLPLPAEKAIAKLAGRGDRFELILADPPYAANAVAPLLSLLGQHPLLEPGGRLAIEHGKHEDAPEVSGPFTREDQRFFGETVLSIYRLT
jgi:16S rRNA (guanine(966)-N(2))-methyltransferase RsmD